MRCLKLCFHHAKRCLCPSNLLHQRRQGKWWTLLLHLLLSHGPVIARGANNLPSANPVTVILVVGSNAGSATVNAYFLDGEV